MRRAIRTALAALIPIAWAGCATTGGGASDAAASVGASGAASGSSAATTGAEVALTRVGEAVQLTEDAEETHECEFVTHLLIDPTRISDVNAIRALRNEAGRRGANLVLLVMVSRTMIEHAEGYLCAD